MALAESSSANPQSIRGVLALLGRVMGRSYRHAERNLIAISVCGASGMPLYYFIWHDLFPQPYENFTLRLIGAGMCLPFIFKDLWPKSMQRYIPVLWYAAILYILPFFFTFMTLKNDFSAVWLASFVAALLLLVFLVDWLNLILLTAFGMFLAWGAFALTGGVVGDPAVYLQLMPIVLFVLVVGTVFSYRNEMLKQERLDAMLMAGRNLSYELRSPLLGIRTSSISLSQYLPLLLKTYEMAEEGGLPVREIPSAHRDVLRHSLERLKEETAHANTVIEMLLRNSGGVPIDPAEFREISMAECVRTALARYPFKSEKERKLVKVQLTPDFILCGSESAMIHVVLSLLKYVLTSPARRGGGEVVIELEISPQVNRLRLRDTGGGQSVSRSARLFDELSMLASESGTGPTMGFVKQAVESFSGNITIEEVRGQHTDYVINLPPAVASLAAE